MALFTVQPTELDRRVAQTIARHTNAALENVTETLTWGADEHVLFAAAVAWWLHSRRRDPPRRRYGDHILATTIVSTVLPHVLKKLVNQERPDRETAIGHKNGIPVSGRRLDAFPSGHAVHIGALASAASLLPGGQRRIAWALSGLLVSTRVVLLAHWVSDVAAGLAIGAITERLLRPFTLRPPSRPPRVRRRSPRRKERITF